MYHTHCVEAAAPLQKQCPTHAGASVSNASMAAPLSPGVCSECSSAVTEYSDAERVSLGVGDQPLAKQQKIHTSFLTDSEGQRPPQGYVFPTIVPQNYQHRLSLVKSESALKSAWVCAHNNCAEEESEYEQVSKRRESTSSHSSAGSHHSAAQADADAAQSDKSEENVAVVTDDDSEEVVDIESERTDSNHGSSTGLSRKPTAVTKAVRWANTPTPSSTKAFAESRSMPGTLVDDDTDIEERRARAQFARSRNNAIIWGSTRSNASAADEPVDDFRRTRSTPTVRNALTAVLPCAVTQEAFAATACSVASSLAMLPDATLHRDALLSAVALSRNVVRDKIEAWPAQRPAPRVLVRGRTAIFGTALAFGDALSLIIAILSAHGCVSLKKRVHRFSGKLTCTLSVRASQTGAQFARADLIERGKGEKAVDICISTNDVLHVISTKRRDAFSSLCARLSKVWASVGIAAATPPGVSSASSRRLRPAGPSWRRRHTSLV